MDTAPRLLIISHDVVGRRMAGPGIRAWEMARVLARQQPVALVAPRPIDIPAPFETGSYTWGQAASLAPRLAQADVVLANGHALAAHPELARLPVPLALDLYDPTPLENLESFRAAPAAQRAARQRADAALLRAQLQAADFILCATERQRDLYIGALLALGRLTPARADADPQLRGLIDTVPFGLPAEPPVKRAPALRGVLPGLGEREPLLLWTGGLWDWLDPQTLVAAMPAVLARRPDTHLVFLAGRHPGDVPPMRAPAEAHALAGELGLLGRSIHFYEEWLPYERRADALLEADVAVSLHRAHLETVYAALRSRFLDHLWAGLPSVVSAGDAAAALVERHRLGRVAPVGDAAGVARAILELLEDDEERAACGRRARALAGELTWERALAPLARYCARPTMNREETDDTQAAAAPPRPAPGASEGDPEAYREKVAALDHLWQVRPQELTSALPALGRAKRAANTLTRWYVAPIVEQQNTFNAATVHALQAIAETLSRLVAEQPALRQHLADIAQHLADIDEAQTALARRIAEMRDT
ncbi:MAG TPA: glycosyltransferase family 4 protein [Roseiflexaceae bacterium]|nr:glycosyltransferase family 4 protein [Roseiflexaceae bacterium]